TCRTEGVALNALDPARLQDRREVVLVHSPDRGLGRGTHDRDLVKAAVRRRGIGPVGRELRRPRARDEREKRQGRDGEPGGRGVLQGISTSSGWAAGWTSMRMPGPDPGG